MYLRKCIIKCWFLMKQKKWSNGKSKNNKNLPQQLDGVSQSYRAPISRQSFVVTGQRSIPSSPGSRSHRSESGLQRWWSKSQLSILNITLVCNTAAQPSQPRGWVLVQGVPPYLMSKMGFCLIVFNLLLTFCLMFVDKKPYSQAVAASQTYLFPPTLRMSNAI